MSTTYKLPTESAVSNLLEMLIGKAVKIVKGSAIEKDPESHIATGIYVNQENDICAVCHLDFPLASFSAAALSMVPVNIAKECIKSGDMPKLISDNLYEILNVCVGFFNTGNVPHIRLSDMQLTQQKAVPEAINAFSSGEVKQLDLDVSVPGYGDGKLSLLVS